MRFVLQTFGFVVFFILLLILVPFGKFMFQDYCFSEKLENVDREAFLLCQSIAQNKIFTKGKVEFFISRNIGNEVIGAYVYPPKCPFVMFFFRNKIFLYPKSLKKKKDFLKTIIAHELGHIEYETADQIRADQFASSILGRKAVLDFLLYTEENVFGVDLSEIEKRKLALGKIKKGQK